MANSLPFNAVAVDGEYDRVYKAEDWAWYFATFIANGIFPKPSDGLQVVAYSGMEIRVNAGYAFINGYAFRNPATLSVTLDTAEGALNRVDRVVVRWDLPQRDMYIAVLKGTPSAKPTATAVTRTTFLLFLLFLCTPYKRLNVGNFLVMCANSFFGFFIQPIPLRNFLIFFLFLQIPFRFFYCIFQISRICKMPHIFCFSDFIACLSHLLAPSLPFLCFS